MKLIEFNLRYVTTYLFLLCVHMHQRIFAIEGWGSPSHIRSIMEKIGEISWKLKKIGRTVS
jgi:hypothetical protein